MRFNGVTDRSYWQPVMHDFNQDGWQDMYLAVDYKANVFGYNTTTGIFQDVADTVGAASDWNDMGVALGDYDNDTDIDIYVTNIWLPKTKRRNVLYNYDSASGTFTDVGAQAGVGNGGWGWGATWLDADLDGLLDLATTNGREGHPKFETDPSVFFWNRGADPIYFRDVSDDVGFNDTLIGTALIAFDQDRDGDLDLLQTCTEGPMRLLDGEVFDAAKQNHYLTVRPRIDGPNHWAIGALVRATVGDTTMTRVITAGTSQGGQEPAEAHFGLGPNDVVQEVSVQWPDGTTTSVSDVAAGQVFDIVKP